MRGSATELTKDALQKLRTLARLGTFRSHSLDEMLSHFSEIGTPDSPPTNLQTTFGFELLDLVAESSRTEYVSMNRPTNRITIGKNINPSVFKDRKDLAQLPNFNIQELKKAFPAWLGKDFFTRIEVFSEPSSDESTNSPSVGVVIQISKDSKSWTSKVCSSLHFEDDKWNFIPIRNTPLSQEITLPILQVLASHLKNREIQPHLR